MKINVLIGVNVTLDILFKKESIITGTLNNMSARVRLFDDSGQLVSEWMSSEGVYVTNATSAPAYEAIAANGVLTPDAGTSPFVDGNGNHEPNALYPFIYQGPTGLIGDTNTFIRLTGLQLRPIKHNTAPCPNGRSATAAARRKGHYGRLL